MVDERRRADLNDFERGLVALVPQVDGLDRDEVLFLAGQRSVPAPRRRWRWPAATGVSTLVAAVLAVLLLLQAGDREGPNGPTQANAPPDESPSAVSPRVADGRVGPQRTTEDPWAPSYLRLRQIALASGIDAIPDLPIRATSPVEPYRPLRVIESRHRKFR